MDGGSAGVAGAFTCLTGDFRVSPLHLKAYGEVSTDSVDTGSMMPILFIKQIFQAHCYMPFFIRQP